jgi:arylsulfatase A-like enzyme
MYDPATLPLPHQDRADNQDLPWASRRLALSDAHWQKVKAYYYALVSHVDDQVGRILVYLEEAGLMDNTLVIFTSDHGEYLGDHGLVQKGPPGLESCAHVPLLWTYPGKVRGGQRVSALIESVDIAPTILDFCGVQRPPFFQGRSFRKLIEGDAAASADTSADAYKMRNSVYIEHKAPFKRSWKTVRTQHFKYCTSDTGTELLYDLQDDPHEQRNVAHHPEYHEARERMRHELIRRWFTVENQYPLKTGAY